MKKISITFNEYEYGYIRRARDIANEEVMLNIDTKDILYSFVIYTTGKIMDGRHLNRFVNIFLIKNNEKPLDADDMNSFVKINDVYYKLSDEKKYFYELPVLYVLRLDDDIIRVLEVMKKRVISKAPNLKPPNYSELFRNAVHFVIDNYIFRKDFFSVLYMIKYCPESDIPRLFADVFSLEKYNAILSQRTYKNESYFCQEINDNIKTYDKLKEWILKTKLDEKNNELLKISERIGTYYNGKIAVNSFVDFVFFLDSLYNNFNYDCILSSHFDFDRTISNFLDESKEMYIKAMDKFLAVLKNKCKEIN
jgi:hypothetical protein